MPIKSISIHLKFHVILIKFLRLFIRPPCSSPPCILGYAICFYSYSTWQGKSLFVEDIYVKPNYRKHGVGKTLFTELAKHAKETNCKRIDLHVLEWNPARHFYEKYGAMNLTGKEQWLFYRFNEQAIDQLIA